MGTTVLSVALSASLDHNIETCAIRLTLGLHEEIIKSLAVPNRDGPRTEAFIAHEYLEHLTGLDHRTIPKAAQRAEKQIGLVVRSGNGIKDRLMHATTHGQAQGWMLTEPLMFPPLPDVDLRGAAEFLNPACDMWGKYPAYEGGPCGGHRGWRLAMAFAATKGTTKIETTTSEVAGLLGTNPSQASNHLLALGKAILVRKTSRGHWTVYLDASDPGDARIEHKAMNDAHDRRVAWKTRLTTSKEAAA